MKFGKTLTKVRSACSTHWAPKWLDYKALKIKIKGLKATSSGTCALNKRSPAVPLKREELKGDPKEAEFFSALHRELKKSDVFIEKESKKLTQRYQLIKNSEEPNNKLRLEALVALYRDCVELEAYSVTQYCAFSKILKKHDKRTGYTFSFVDLFETNIHQV